MGLFEPIWKTNKTEKLNEALAAVKAADDPKKLREIALSAYFTELKLAAIEKITDPQTLQEIILSDSSPYEVRRFAVEQISDPQVLTGIAMQRQAYPADGSAVAVLTDQKLLKEIALAEQGGEQDKAVYKITDQQDLAEIAVFAKKGGARRTAIRNITDPDILIGIMTRAEEGYTRSEAHLRMKNLIEAPEKLSLTDDQHERYLNVIINEKDRNVHIDLVGFDSSDDLKRIYQKAQRFDLRAAALGYLVLQKDYPSDELLSAWKSADMNRKTVHNTYANPWMDARTSVEDRLEMEEINRPELLVEFISDPEVSIDYAAKCIKALFSDMFRSYPEIPDLQDQAFAAFLRNIPRYVEQDEQTDAAGCLLLLTDAVPPELRERYGLSVFAEEYGTPGRQ